ncbi:MAG: hypothetical protein K1X55_11200 [Chitinophagales bacterium]|nr:hypothetical protein [Chitinophagales bacterium]
MKKQFDYNGLSIAKKAIKIWLLTLFFWAWIGSGDNIHIIPATGFLAACLLSINLIIPFFLIIYLAEILAKSRKQSILFIFTSGQVLIHAFALFCCAFFEPFNFHHTVFLHFSIALSYGLAITAVFSFRFIKIWIKSISFKSTSPSFTTK